MSLSKEDIFNKLKDMSVTEIINWIIVNVSVDNILECLKTIDPNYYQNFLRSKAASSTGMKGIDTFPINFSVQPDSLDDIKMYVEDLCHGTRIIPLAVFPVLLPDTDIFQGGYIQSNFDEVKDDVKQKHNGKVNSPEFKEEWKATLEGLVQNEVETRLTSVPTGDYFVKDKQGRQFTILYTKITPSGKYVTSYVQTASLSEIESFSQKKSYKLENPLDPNSRERLVAQAITEYVMIFIDILYRIGKKYF